MMRRTIFSRATAVAATLAVVVLAGCSEIDDPFERVGAMRVFPVDPGQRFPTLEESGVQAAEFRISRARAHFQNEDVDLLGGTGTCPVVDTILTGPVFDTDLPCALGIVVGEARTPTPLTLDLELEMDLHRVEPLLLERNDDFDADGFPNFIDNCPLIANPEQTDADADGLGDACQTPSATAGINLLDNDADGVADLIDNCDYFPNADQVDRSPYPGAPYGIGTACPEQVARLRQDGSTTLHFQLTIDDFVQDALAVSFITIDLDSRDAMTCDWALGYCDLLPGLVPVCVRTSGGEALGGC